MASVSKEPNGRRSLQFVAADGKRKSIRLGKISQHAAESVKIKVEILNAAVIAGVPIDGETAKWLAGIGADLHARLAAVGLVSPRQSPEPKSPCPALEGFLSSYIDGRTDHKPNTRKTIDQTRRRLVAHFGTNMPIDTITAADAEDWRNALRAKGYKPATIATHVKKAKQMFQYAVNGELLARNPFAGLKAPQQVDKSREEFVGPETIRRVIEAAPDVEWRLIIALARFGGLRCPSEVLAFQWQWVDWERERLTVFAPKLEHLSGGGWRSVPLFPELRPYLEEAFELAPEGSSHVITRYRDAGANLRTHFQRIIRRAGVQPWGRLFHNLRSSRQTELTETFPAHVVAAWLGNTVKVATQHYLQVTEDHFQRAAKSGAVVVQNPVQQATAPSRAVSQEPLQVASLAGDCETVRLDASRREEEDYPRQESNL